MSDLGSEQCVRAGGMLGSQETMSVPGTGLLRYVEGSKTFSFTLCLLVKIDILEFKKSVDCCSTITGLGLEL